MADETTSTTTQYSLPPEYIQQFLAGGGAGVPGLFPLLNASMYNQFATIILMGENELQALHLEKQKPLD